MDKLEKIAQGIKKSFAEAVGYIFDPESRLLKQELRKRGTKLVREMFDLYISNYGNNLERCLEIGNEAIHSIDSSINLDSFILTKKEGSPHVKVYTNSNQDSPVKEIHIRSSKSSLSSICKLFESGIKEKGLTDYSGILVIIDDERKYDLAEIFQANYDDEIIPDVPMRFVYKGNQVKIVQQELESFKTSKKIKINFQKYESKEAAEKFVRDFEKGKSSVRKKRDVLKTNICGIDGPEFTYPGTKSISVFRCIDDIVLDLTSVDFNKKTEIGDFHDHVRELVTAIKIKKETLDKKKKSKWDEILLGEADKPFTWTVQKTQPDPNKLMKFQINLPSIEDNKDQYFLLAEDTFRTPDPNKKNFNRIAFKLKNGFELQIYTPDSYKNYIHDEETGWELYKSRTREKIKEGIEKIRTSTRAVIESSKLMRREKKALGTFQWFWKELEQISRREYISRLSILREDILESPNESSMKRNLQMYMDLYSQFIYDFGKYSSQINSDFESSVLKLPEDVLDKKRVHKNLASLESRLKLSKKIAEWTLNEGFKSSTNYDKTLRLYEQTRLNYTNEALLDYTTKLMGMRDEFAHLIGMGVMQYIEREHGSSQRFVDIRKKYCVLSKKSGVYLPRGMNEEHVINLIKHSKNERKKSTYLGKGKINLKKDAGVYLTKDIRSAILSEINEVYHSIN